MEIMQAIFLGIVQGLTEFLPISSSGHLVFLPKFFGWQDQGLSFDVVVHLGTLLAVLVFFWSKISKLVPNLFSKKLPKEHRLVWYIILSIIPAGVIGFFFGDWIEVSLRSTRVIGWSLLIWGIVLGLADHYSSHLKKKKSTDNIKTKSAVFIWCAQAIALIPGTSRSGITMTAGLFSGLTKKATAEFSFLISIPIIALAGFLKVYELFQAGTGDLSIAALVAGFASSSIAGFFAISWLLKIIQKWNFMPFAVYRIVVGILILMFL